MTCGARCQEVPRQAKFRAKVPELLLERQNLLSDCPIVSGLTVLITVVGCILLSAKVICFILVPQHGAAKSGRWDRVGFCSDTVTPFYIEQNANFENRENRGLLAQW